MSNQDVKKPAFCGSSSIIDLKAELLKKQEEIKRQKLQRAAGIKPVKPLPKEKEKNVWSKRNSGVLERAQRDFEEKQEEDDVLGRSAKALAAKAKLYEKITSANEIPEEDGSHTFLIDFQQKAIHSISEKREEERKQREKEEQRQKEEAEAEEDRKMLLVSVDPPKHPDDEWMDYEDSFGRSRKCLRKDLPEILKMDKNIKKSTIDPPTNSEPHLLSSDMKRELERQKWEEEAQLDENKDVGPIHYSNVRQNEVRTHGVGFYEFSQNEDARQEEMETLLKLRDQTKEQQHKLANYKAKRKAILKARLLKVKQRKLVQEGMDPSQLQEESSGSDDDMIGPKPSEAVAPLVRDDSWRQDAPEREWDVGKVAPTLYEKKLQELRDERPEEFAPPSMYYENTKKSASDKAKDHAKITISNKNKPKYNTSVSEAVYHDIKDPMAMLEKSNSNDLHTNDSKLEENVAESLSAIRSEVEKEKISDDGTDRNDKFWPKKVDLNTSLPTDSSLHKQSNEGFSVVTNTPQTDYEKYCYEYYAYYGQYPHTWQGQHSNVISAPNFSHPSTQYSLPPPAVSFSSCSTSYPPPPFLQSVPNFTQQPPPPPPPLQNMPQDSVSTISTKQDHSIISAPNFSHPSTQYSLPPPAVSFSSCSTSYPPSPFLQSVPNFTQQPPPPPPHLQNMPQDSVSSTSTQQDQSLASTPQNGLAQSLPPGTGYAAPVHPVSGDSQTIRSESVNQIENFSGTRTVDSTCNSSVSSKSATVHTQPQPAHYASGPMKVQPKAAKFCAVPLYQIPPSLPAPPSVGTIPHYKSQEQFNAPPTAKSSQPNKNEQDSIKYWQKQFDKAPNTGGLKPAKIPFVSPFVQKKEDDEQRKDIEFDPSKPPPITK